MKKHATSRRRFLQAVPATLAAGVALPIVPKGPGLPFAQRGGQQTPPHFGKDALKGAEQIAGLKFTDAEEDAALGGVSRNLDSYETIRKLDVPMSTEPAITFHPRRERTTKAAPPARAKIAFAKPPRVQMSASLEDLAFEPVTALASLVESRRITSTDLTKMYLGRPKKYGDQLHCVITLTEDLALEQAAAADRDIKAGRYRGPLHGIPWGAKDLFDTKGIRTTWGAKPYENRVPDVDATIVDRLRDAGAVLVAKLS
ncbi:MAG TPA: amidase family protein, partial [Vicinamibacterales bacterium]|nr:amidase family protein [Vicinamibacterales bacterium]